MAIYCLADPHGNFKALKEVLTLSGFDYDKDKIIILGDVCDGHNQTKECVDELLKIKHRVFVVGNHDLWFGNYIRDMDNRLQHWVYSGGAATIESYARSEPWIIPEAHRHFFLEEWVPYHTEGNVLFVHGGMGENDSPTFCDLETLTWDRSMIERAKKCKIGTWDKIFVGHTSTQFIEKDHISCVCNKCHKEWKEEVSTECKYCKSNTIFCAFGKTEPIRYNNVWMLDCGAGGTGKICLYNIETGKYWLSQLTQESW